MGTTLAEMKARLQQLNQRTGKKANDLFKAKDEHELRLLPDPDGGDPFVIRVFHYELGGQSVLCPKANFGDECEVCEFCEVLRAWKDPKTGQDKPESERRADFEIFKKIQPTEKALVRCVELMPDGSLSAEGPKWWAPGYTNTNKIIEICSDVERQAAVGLAAGSDEGLNVLFDPTKAYNLKIVFRDKAGTPGAKGNKKNRSVTEIKDCTLSPKALLKDKKELAKLLSSCKDINEVYQKQTSAEVSTVFKKFVGSGQQEAKADGGTEKYASNTKEDAKIQGGRSIDDAFDDMSQTP